MPMREYTCAPKPRSRRAYLYVLGCVLLAVALWTVPMLFAQVPYRLVFHFLAMFSLTVALLITTRYLLKRYIYRFVATDDGGFDFVVLEISGKRTVCVCRVSVDGFRAFVPADKKHRIRPTYNWCVDPHAPAYLLTLVDGDERFFENAEEATVRFSPDREMAAMIEYSLNRPKF